MPDRVVRFTDQFFNRLDALLSQERDADGAPSVTDFIVHELPRIRDRLSEDFERNTAPTGERDVRVYVSGGGAFKAIAVYVALEGSDVEAFWLSIDRDDDFEESPD